MHETATGRSVGNPGLVQAPVLTCLNTELVVLMSAKSGVFCTFEGNLLI